MPNSSPSPRVLLLSAVGTGVNPYLGLLRDGLTAAGAEVRLATRLAPADLVGPARPDIIHLHWLDRYDLPPAILARRLHGATRAPWGVPRRAARRLIETVANLPAVYQARRWRRLAALFDQLQSFQARGGRVAYTVHNLDPHEGGGPADRWGAAWLIRLADAIHVHDASTAGELAARFGRREGVAIIPHGHYLGSYPNTIGRDTARDRLGVPAEAFVYATLGLLRPYKGLEELLPAFRRSAAADAVLLLAGQPGSSDYAARLAALTAGDVRIRLHPRFVSPEEIQVYLNAADVCVLPYRQITTSGAALLAFSFGAPVVAPAIGAFPNLIAGPRGLLYDSADPNGLSSALVEARRRDWAAARPKILSWVAQFDWGEIGRRLVEVYGVRREA